MESHCSIIIIFYLHLDIDLVCGRIGKLFVRECIATYLVEILIQV